MASRHDYRGLAEAQHGLLTGEQLEGLGLTASGSKHLRRNGSVERVGLRTLRVAGSVRSEEQAALAAVLEAGPDAALSHRSAACIWGVAGFAMHPLEVTTSRRSMPTSARLARVHRMRGFDASHRTVLDGIPIVRPELLALQLCAMLHPARAERALDSMWSRRLLSGPSARRVLDEVAASGVRGVSDIASAPRRARAGLRATGIEPRGPLRADPPRRSSSRRCCARSTPAMRCAGAAASTSPIRREARHARSMEVDSERYHSALVDRRG